MRRITAPLTRLQSQVRRLRNHRYGEPLQVSGRDEIADLGRAFEDLRGELVRIEELRKDVISDLAHEVMTPLQTMTGIVEGIEAGVYQPQEKTGELKAAVERVVRLHSIVGAGSTVTIEIPV